MSHRSITIKRFLRSKFFIIGGALVLIICFLSVFSNFIVRYDPTIPDFSSRFVPPEWFSQGLSGHILGTDSMGRDMLARLLVGSQYSLIVAFVAVSSAALIGVILGMIAGFYGGWLDTLIMRFGDIQLSIPSLMLAITIVAIAGPNLVNLVIVLIFTSWVGYARLIRSVVQVVRKQEFVSASKVLGASNRWIMFRQVFPNVLTPLIVQTSQSFGTMILVEAALSFLGLGVQPPTPSWGVMISNGRESLQAAPWTVLVPGIMLMITVLAFNFMGDGIRDALDPKMK